MQILMLTVYEDTDQIFKALAAGASGYLLKRSSPTKLLQGDSGSSFRWFAHVQFYRAQSRRVISKIKTDRRKADSSFTPRGNGLGLPGQRG